MYIQYTDYKKTQLPGSALGIKGGKQNEVFEYNVTHSRLLHKDEE